MNLQAMVDALVAQTSLESRRDEFTRRVREAITSIHNSAFFVRDKIEDLMDMSYNTHTNIKIPYPARCRRINIIKPLDLEKKVMELTTPDNAYQKTNESRLLDYWGEDKQDVYYEIQGVITISSTVAPQFLYLNYYVQPHVANPNLETWLMKENEQIFMDWALSRFHTLNGRRTEGRDMMQTILTMDLPSLHENFETES